MNNLKELQQQYARLVVREGLNVQPGQRLVIACPVDGAYFARLVATEAYEVGCREVVMRWSDDFLTREKYLKADDSIFDEVNAWDVLQADKLSEEGAAWLSIHAADPENLKGVDAGRIRRSQKASGQAMAAFRQRQMRNGFAWCVCAIPCPAWTAKVFPDLNPEAGEMKLWEEILKACRVEEGGDAVAAWQAHSGKLHERMERLNALELQSLHFVNAAGTDLTVKLPQGHFWAGGSEKTEGGVEFSANIPTEEIFTLPHREGVDGVVVASKPLALHGNLVENFRLTLEKGKIVDVQAESGAEILRDAISVDEGASYLGEVALVPYHSPISNSGILFYNTLFDENASCHFAFGSAYPCLKDAAKLTEEQLKERGMNDSMTHVDFMIGTADLSITGVTGEGKEVAIFVNGDFAF